MSQTQDFATPRSIGPVVYTLWLARVPLVITVILVATLSDLAIDGSMREALRYSILDAPMQLVFIAGALLIACVTLRYTAEGNIALVSPNLIGTPGTVGIFARVLPRAFPALVGAAAGLPILELAADADALGSSEHRAVAAVAGLGFVLIGIVVAGLARGPKTSGPDMRAPSHILRATIALFPLVIAGVFCGAVLGLWAPNSGTAYHVLERYVSAGAGCWDQITGAVPGALAGFVRHAPLRYQPYTTGTTLIVPTVSAGLVVAEILSVLIACIAARLAVAVFLDLLLPGLATGGSLTRFLRDWLPRAAAVAVAFALAGEVLHAYLRPGAARELSMAETIWVWAIALVFALIGVGASFGHGSMAAPESGWHETRSIPRRCVGAAERLSAMNAGWRWFFALSIVAAIGVFAYFVNVEQVARAQTIGPVAIILLWGFTAAALFFPIAYLSHMTRMHLLTILALAAVTYAGFDLNDNHELRGSEPQVANATPQPDNRNYLQLDTWLQSRSDWQAYDHYPVFLVATEGGGIRAAYFTASVLAAIQERCPLFSQHTMLVSGVSGGSVGAAVFAALAADHAHNVKDAPCPLEGVKTGPLVTRARSVLSADLLSPLLSATLFPDALQRILPMPVPQFDRSRAIEYAIEDSWAKATTSGCGLCDAHRMSDNAALLYKSPGVASAVPYLFLNTTEAGSGRSIPYSTVRVTDLATTFRDEAEIDQDPDAQYESVSLQDNMPVDDVPLSSAAILSARFPYLTPAGSVATASHYVDGGYFENSGTWIVSGIVQNLVGQQLVYKNSANPALEKAVRNAVFITLVIQSEPCTRRVDLAPCDEEGAGSDTSWSEALSPLRALLNTRDKRASYSIDDLSAMTALVEQLSGGDTAQAVPNAAKDSTGCHYRICAVTLRFYNAPRVEVPLTWVLSSQARKAMDQAVDGMEQDDVRNIAAASGALPSDNRGGNKVLGSYRRIICILDARRDATQCPVSAPTSASAATVGP